MGKTCNQGYSTQQGCHSELNKRESFPDKQKQKQTSLRRNAKGSSLVNGGGGKKAITKNKTYGGKNLIGKELILNSDRPTD